MAEAKRDTITKTVTIDTHEPVVVLTLSNEEAKWLRQVLALVGGHPDTTPRGHIDSIGKALGDLGFDFRSSCDPDYPFEFRSHLMFKDYLDI